MRHSIFVILAASLSGAVASAQPAQVPAFRQTTPGPTTIGGSIRDVALWVAPRSADAGTDAGPGGLLLTAYDNQNAGLATFGLDGQQLEDEQLDGPVASVAVRDGFRLGANTLSVAVTSNLNRGLTAYSVDGLRATDRVQRIGTGPFLLTSAGYTSVAFYRSPSSGRLFVFASNDVGSLSQFEMSGEDGGVSATLVNRPISVGGAVTGMVVDEERGHLYVVQAGAAIWRYAAEPDGGATRTQVVSLTATDSKLSRNVNRLALYRAAGTEGYLLAADTQAGTFAVLDRRTYAFLGSFTVVPGDGGVGGAVAPRALAVTSGPVGAFADGLFVAQSSSGTGTDDLKLVRWETVAQAFNPPLRIDTRPTPSDGGVDAGVDAGSDGGGGGGVGPGPLPGGGIPPVDAGSGCTCASASVPGSVLLGLLALGMSLRRRRER
ncbi:phytase [Myxococcus stipitatus DSM 14675]|uniref:Phytase n=1 Tax=Myxococcus stipitatus (strain DSM 14675 / JCM 12634 / Mx s8) TaxID=1278073 RepID=L7UH05_MYXSD|nr:myxosortase-dependent phytase-like phosphatase [Myxococcus stipitatus]AGC47165.1 phytase [Myxococcus stipitatus DSM 14675]